MKKIRKLLLLSSIIPAIFLGLTGCSTKGDMNTPAVASEPVKDELVFVNFRDVRDLNPHLYAGEMYAQEMLYETLISLNSDGGYEPCLAESYVVSEDGMEYRFKIREGVTFSDGEVCDANAIKANFDAIIANKERHSWLEFMNVYNSFEVPDEHTFVIKLNKPYYPLLTELAVTRPFAMISPAAMIDGQTKDGVKAHIGTGPYVLTSVEVDQYAVFERNENYWGEKPKIKKITVKVIPDNQTRIMALESGEVDLIYGKNMLDAEAVKNYQSHEKIGVLLSEPTSTRHILINSSNEILKDLNVRKAIQHATNKTQISEGIFYGLEKPADTLYARTVAYADIELKPYAYDVDLSASLLEGAGWVLGDEGYRMKGGKVLELGLLFNISSVTEKSIAEYLQAEYKKMGIKLNIKGEEEQSYRDNMKAGHFDMVFNISWGTPYDPQSSLAGMRQTVYGDYAAQLGLEDKAVIDEKISQVLVSTNENTRQALYTEILTMLHEDALYLPLTYENNKTLFSKELKGIEFAPSQYEIPFAKMYFE